MAVWLIPGNATVELNLTNVPGLTPFTNIQLFIDDGGNPEDVVIEIGDQANAEFPIGTELTFYRFNAVTPISESGALFTAIESQKIIQISGYQPTFGVINELAQQAKLIKIGDDLWFFTGDIDLAP